MDNRFDDPEHEVLPRDLGVSLDTEYGSLPDPTQGKGRPISIGELTRRCNDAASKMGNNNPHKLLLLNCGFALQQLFRRIDELENPPSLIHRM
jgi:hypothetical protein